MRLKLKQIADVVSEVWEVDIRSKRRDSWSFLARQCYYHIAKKYLFFTVVKLAKEVNRTHGTLINALNKFERDFKEPLHSKLYDQCLSELGIKPKTEEVHVVEKKEESFTGVMLDVLRDLKQLSDGQLSEFHETRLKPFKKTLESRIKPIEVAEVCGAIIKRTKL